MPSSTARSARSTRKGARGSGSCSRRPARSSSSRSTYLPSTVAGRSRFPSTERGSGWRLCSIRCPVGPVLAAFDDGAALARSRRGAQGLEGVVAKRASIACYRPGRRPMRVAEGQAAAVSRLVVAGYTRGNRSAQVVGRSPRQGTDAGVLVAGNVGTGLSEPRSRGCRRARPRERPRSPFSSAEAARVREVDVTWVEPRLVAEVEFAEWTREGRLVRSLYLRIREDEEVAEVTRERAPLPALVKRGRRELRLSTSTSRSGPTRGSPRAICSPTTGRRRRRSLPHLRGRPFTMKRYPDGWQGKSFFQKDAPAHMPEWLALAPLRRPRGRREKKNRSTTRSSTTSSPLLWVASMGCIDLHAWYVTCRFAGAARLGHLRPGSVRGGRGSRRWSRWRASYKRDTKA